MPVDQSTEREPVLGGGRRGERNEVVVLRGKDSVTLEEWMFHTQVKVTKEGIVKARGHFVTPST